MDGGWRTEDGGPTPTRALGWGSALRPPSSILRPCEESTMPTNSDGQLRERVALVTGAAQGIGRATTLLLTGRGAQVVAEVLDAVALTLLAQPALGGSALTPGTRRLAEVAEVGAEALPFALRHHDFIHPV